MCCVGSNDGIARLPGKGVKTVQVKIPQSWLLAVVTEIQLFPVTNAPDLLQAFR